MGTFSSNSDGKTAGIISYLTIVGWLIAYFALYKNNRTAQASYQMRQTLLFHIVSLVVYYAMGIIIGAAFYTTGVFITGLLIWIIRAGLFIIWLTGLLGAINGDSKPIPLIGEKAQSVFSGI